MNEDFLIFNLGFDEYLKLKWQKIEEIRFVKLNDDELDDFVEGVLVKFIKYVINYVVLVFKGNFLV